MTGAQHYRIAEKLLAEARMENGHTAQGRAEMHTLAHVHATLALAAATAMANPGAHAYQAETHAWTNALGVPRIAPLS